MRPYYTTIEVMEDGQKSIVVHQVTQADWDAKCAGNAALRDLIITSNESESS